MKIIKFYAAVVLTFAIMMNTRSYADEMQILTLEEPPFNFTNEKGEITGISVDVVKEIQKRIGNTDEILVYPWARAKWMALNKPNVVLFTAVRNNEREDKFYWIINIAREMTTFYAKRGSGIKINSLDDAKKVKKIGVLRSGAKIKYLRNHGFKNLQTVTNHQQNIRMLLAERVSLIYFASTILGPICKDLGIRTNEFEPVFTTHKSLSYVVISKNGTPIKTIEKWQNAAKLIKEDGSYNRIAQKWIKKLKGKYDVEYHVKDGTLNLWEK